jgi:thermitase
MSRKLWIACSLLLVFLLVTASALAQEDVSPPEDRTIRAEYVPGEILVQFRPGVSAEKADRLSQAYGISRKGGVPALQVHVLHLPPGLPVEKAVETFNKIPEVEYSEPNYLFQAVQVSESWQDNQWAPQKIQAPEAWAQVTAPAQVTVALVDTGVDYRHSQLGPTWAQSVEEAGSGHRRRWQRLYRRPAWLGFLTTTPCLDDHFHGTHGRASPRPPKARYRTV